MYPPFDIFDESRDINQTTLQLLVLLSKAYEHTREEFVMFPTMCPNMSRAVYVHTNAQEIEYLRQTVAQMAAKLEDLRARLLSLQHKKKTTKH